jgi:hypothetical protein
MIRKNRIYVQPPILAVPAMIVMVMIYLIGWWWPQPECPPQWKCNGTVETNDPNCKCLDTR